MFFISMPRGLHQFAVLYVLLGSVYNALNMNIGLEWFWYFKDTPYAILEIESRKMPSKRKEAKRKWKKKGGENKRMCSQREQTNSFLWLTGDLDLKLLERVELDRHNNPCCNLLVLCLDVFRLWVCERANKRLWYCDWWLPLGSTGSTLPFVWVRWNYE